MSRQERAEPLTKMLMRAQAFSHFEFSPYKKALDHMTKNNWFEEPDDAKMVDEMIKYTI